MRRFLTSTDHRDVGLSYMFTGAAFLLMGGILAMLMRWQLGFPNHSHMLPDYYDQLFTMHGTIMIFFAVVPILLNGFGSYLVPLMIGARSLAFPRLSRAAFWLYTAAGIFLLSSFSLGSGAAKSGWFAYPPLSVVESSGQTVWIISLMIAGVAAMLAAIVMITTIANMRVVGMEFFRLPLTVWSILFASIIVLLAYPSLLVAIGCLLSDRIAGTSFFMPAGLFIHGHTLDRSGGQPLLWQHLFWFFGHPEVYIVIMPAMGIVSDVLTVFSRKPLFGYRGMVLALAAIGGLGFLVWGHHMFVSGMNPTLGTTFMLSTVVIAVPSGIKTFNWLATLWQGSIRFTPAMLAALGFISLFVIGGLSGIFLAMTPIDIYLHNTTFVIGHFHFMMVGGALFGILAAVYYWFPLMSGRRMNQTLGQIHVAISFVLFVCLFYPMFALGLAGEPRRLFQYNIYPQLMPYQPIRAFMTVCAFLMFATQGLLLWNLFWSLWKGERSSDNPWLANTLEWMRTTPTRVVHGPYEYSVPGQSTDWTPQSELTEPARS